MVAVVCNTVYFDGYRHRLLFLALRLCYQSSFIPINSIPKYECMRVCMYVCVCVCPQNLLPCLETIEEIGS